VVVEATVGPDVPRQLFLPIYRRLVSPLHLFCLALLLGGVSPVAGNIKLQDPEGAVVPASGSI